MKTQISAQRTLTFEVALLGIFFTVGAAGQVADSRTNCWLTTYSGKYARIYTNDAMLASGTVLTTWSNGTQTQSPPAYCGVQEVYSSSNSVYIRSSGLASYNMGPWQNGAFPNLPVNQKLLYRLPRTNSVPATKSITEQGQVGVFVDGVEMFNSWDAFYWNGTADTSGAGTGYWNRDAYVNEGPTFDPANAHQQNTGTYHYHANPPGLRYLLGDNVNYSTATKTYSESTNTPVKHSPILGWVSDGFPVYGPYGYASATNANSGIRRMIPGYVIRNGSYGTSNLTANGRTTLPQWAVRLYNVSFNQSGPAVSASYPLGRYMEDNDYLGDHGYTQGVDFDLDEYNGRFCVTPEFPSGTYAYFVAISSNGTPLFPYNIGRGYYGSPSGGGVSAINEAVTTNFLGGPEAPPLLNPPGAKNGIVTLTWSATEGGTYTVQSTTNFPAWTTNSTNIAAVLNMASYTNNLTDAYRFYRVAQTSLAAYDPVGTGGGASGGGGETFSVPGGGVSRGNGTNITLTITLSAPPNLPPANAPIASVTLGSLTAASTSDATQGTVVANFTIPATAMTGAQTVVVTFSPPPNQTQGPVYALTGGFTINP